MKLNFPFRRNAKNRESFIGSDPATDKFYLYINEEGKDAESQQDTRIGFSEIIMKLRHDGDGRTYLVDVKTNAERYHLSNAGTVIDSFTEYDPQSSSVRDRIDLQNNLGHPIGRNIINLAIRATRWFGRNNFQPQFNGMAHIPDMEYNTEIPGDGSYVTHNADGTAISGNAAENVDVTPWKAPL